MNPLWVVPDEEAVLVDEARRIADRVADTGEPDRPAVLAVCFAGLADPDAVAARGPDELVAVERESGDGFENGSATAGPRADALRSLAADRARPAAVLLPGTPDGDELASVAARRLRGGCVTDCLLRVREGGLLAGRTAYAGRAYAEYDFEDGPAVVSLFLEALEPREPVPETDPARSRHAVDAPDASGVRRLAVREIPEQDLSRARRIVAGGYGLGDPEGFDTVRDLADALGAAVGASRPPADEGWVPYDRQIGVTGEEIDTELYVPAAISGDPYHMRSVSADHLIAINADPEARIFNMSDLGVVGDVYEYAPAIAGAVREAREQDAGDGASGDGDGGAGGEGGDGGAGGGRGGGTAEESGASAETAEETETGESADTSESAETGESAASAAGDAGVSE